MEKKQKNILFIVVDCLGADFIYEKEKSYIPTINKLKENGYSFYNTIASTTTTTPSFAAILTGLYPFQNGVRSHSGYSLKKGVKTLPEILKEKGYNTYAEVTGPLTKEIGLMKGFDEYNHRNPKETIHKKFGKLLLKKFANHYKSPWFVFLHIWSLHEPRIVIKECKSKNFGKTLYARAIASIDFYIKKLLEKVDENTIIILTGDHGEQIAHSTLDRYWKKLQTLIFTIKKKSGLTKIHFAKGIRKFALSHGYNIYDILVRVPLIFYNKDIIPKGKSNTQIRHIDIFPTILDFVDIKKSIKVEGESLFPIIKGEKQDNKDAFIEAVGIIIPNKNEWLAGLRVDNKYKYIYSPFRSDFQEELYDLENDPTEKYNIADLNKDLIKKFRKKIENMKTEKLTGEKLSEEQQKKIKERLKALGYMD